MLVYFLNYHRFVSAPFEKSWPAKSFLKREFPANISCWIERRLLILKNGILSQNAPDSICWKPRRGFYERGMWLQHFVHHIWPIIIWHRYKPWLWGVASIYQLVDSSKSKYVHCVILHASLLYFVRIKLACSWFVVVSEIFYVGLLKDNIKQYLNLIMPRL